MRTAFVLGGTGFVGRHVSRRLADAGWDVTVASRGETQVPAEIAELEHVEVDRAAEDSLKNLPGGGVDVLVDVIPYEIDDGHQLLELRGHVGSIVSISTTSVYADDSGRSMDEATSDEDFPQMPVPILETQPRVESGPATYSTKKAAIEDVLLGQSDIPVSVIRPCAIYGPGDTQCREWFFVKRALDRRPFVLLADEGHSVFHTNSVHNLAEMVRLAAEKPVHGAFNCGDPDPPDVKHISRRIAETLGHDWDEILLPRDLSKGFGNPWGGSHPWLVSTKKAEQLLRYRPIVTQEVAIVETVEWIVSETRNQDWREVLPQAAVYLGEKFDYQAEDRFLATLPR